MNWGILSGIILFLSLGLFFSVFEREKKTAKEISLIATLATLAAVSRVPFAVIMSVQPTTFIVMISGYVLGPHIGFIIGATAALVSNIFLGQGPWTPWQMMAWGFAGFSTGIVGLKIEKFRLSSFIIMAFLWGYLFGWIMNLWHWIGFVYPLNLKTFIATYIASFPFDTLHAVGNALFTILFGETIYKVLARYKKKITFERME